MQAEANALLIMNKAPPEAHSQQAWVLQQAAQKQNGHQNSARGSVVITNHSCVVQDCLGIDMQHSVPEWSKGVD